MVTRVLKLDESNETYFKAVRTFSGVRRNRLYVCGNPGVLYDYTKLIDNQLRKPLRQKPDRLNCEKLSSILE